MARLVSMFEQCAWSRQLIFDTSMLRLLVARRSSKYPELVITYGDGRDGGRPTDASLDAFDILIAREGQDAQLLPKLTAEAVIRRVEEWASE
jgi:hypothetical protein